MGIYPATMGVVDLTNPERQKRLLALMDVQDVWGIGSTLSKRLKSLGINTVLQLANANPKFIRTHFSVVVERTVRLSAADEFKPNTQLTLLIYYELENCFQ